MKKSISSLVAALALILCGFASTAHAASIVNGAACSTPGASSTVKVKGVSKAYICKINPAVAGASAPTWTLKTCLSYWAAAQNSQDSINQQRSLVSSMSEPDKTTYTKQLDASQASLNKVIAAIKANHCKAGL
jgi:hypothetical protein